MADFITSRRNVLGILGLSAMGAALPSAAFAQRGAAAALAFGYQNTSWGAIGMIAEAEGMFKKAGGNVTVYRFDSGKTTRDAMVAGRVDIGVLGATPFVVGAAKGEVVAIGMAMYAGKTLSVVAGARSGIADMRQLKGKKIGSQIGSATDSVFQNKILPAFGIAAGDVTIVNIPHPNHIAAVAANSIDAFAGVEPFPSVAEVNGLGKVLVDYSKWDITPVILTANRSAIEQKREAVVAFLRGWLKAIELYRTDPGKAVAIVTKHFQSQGFEITDRAIKLLLSKIDVNPDFIPELRDYLTNEAQTLVANKQIAAVPDWTVRLDASLLSEARKST
ncbi:MAG: ABC transporter substrate-binding protein [Hyphomonadaceae bacterium]|jgi:ABC-type nitrate/sulfonate/bicarbonate transport system substrate-binding protein|nr:ABC transporter substrate-binding protein [Hyphomonadaceae bacterium]